MWKTVRKVVFSKSTTLFFAFAYAILVILGNTFSWITSSAQKMNEFEGQTGMHTFIVDDFAKQNQWEPGTEVTKTVAVYNNGNTPGFTRISFEEILNYFENVGVSKPFADPEESGIVPEYCLTAQWDSWQEASVVFSVVQYHDGTNPAPLPQDVVIKVETSPAGTQRYRYAVYQELEPGKTYRRMTGQFSAQGNTLTVTDLRYWGYEDGYEKSEAAWGMVNETGALTVTPPLASEIYHPVCDTDQKITINYGDLITALTGTPADDNHWYYNQDDGFFYYLGTLEPGDMSRTLMTSLRLEPTAGVTYSSLNLEFIVNMQTVQANTEALQSDWGLPETSPLYQRLASYCS